MISRDLGLRAFLQKLLIPKHPFVQGLFSGLFQVQRAEKCIIHQKLAQSPVLSMKLQ